MMKLKNDILNPLCQGKGIFMFIRAQLSAQIATIADFTISIALHQWFHLYYVYATLTGSVSGGLINCFINYKWTFRSYNCKPAYVLLKYLFVWLGSIGLNLWGTYILTEFFSLQNSFIVLTQSTAFILAKIMVAVLVAILWNYNLHRNFVFKDIQLNQTLRNKLKQLNNQHENKKTSKENA